MTEYIVPPRLLYELLAGRSLSSIAGIGDPQSIQFVSTGTTYRTTLEFIKASMKDPTSTAVADFSVILLIWDTIQRNLDDSFVTTDMLVDSLLGRNAPGRSDSLLALSGLTIRVIENESLMHNATRLQLFEEKLLGPGAKTLTPMDLLDLAWAVDPAAASERQVLRVETSERFRQVCRELRITVLVDAQTRPVVRYVCRPSPTSVGSETKTL